MKEQQRQDLTKAPTSLTTEEARDLFPSGKAMRQWAAEHGLKITIHKGKVDIG